MSFAQGDKQEDEKEALYVGWEKSEPSDSENKQSETTNFGMVDNICFMANEAKEISDFKDIITFEELEDAYEELEKEFKKN